ncbi:MAG TPA: secretin and TonB N-terminal domain-containing protein [Smithellaceae bacterium]|nr:secretin and TonB N-terminal domain-containing protein [Smithellaceae bacterium]
MKKYLSKSLPVLIAVLWIIAYMPVIFAADDAGQKKDDISNADAPNTGYLEKVLLENLPGKERITLALSHRPVISLSSEDKNNLLLKLKDTFVPVDLRRPFSQNNMINILRVTPAQKAMEEKQWVYLTIELKESIPYKIVQGDKSVTIDFNIASLSGNKTSEKKVESPAIQARKEPKKYTDRFISIDFQDADIKSVLRLMAEYGNISIVSGNDVKGNVTLTMKNVPWEQALDTILDINGLAKKQMGDVISVMTLERKKKDEGDKAKAEEDQRKAEDLRIAREQKLLAEKGKLRQVLIEAKIVEATEEFIRKIGVSWGVGNHQSIGSYGLGISAGSSTIQTNASTISYPGNIPWVQGTTTDPLRMAAVNFPAAVAAPTIGLVFGSAAGFLEAQLAALESSLSGKIISAPKVVTMDNVKATIKQGDEVPYITPASGTSPATVSFKEALLKLEVKPRITEEGKISMEIKASNDVPDYAKAPLLSNNAPIRKNEVESTVVIRDGDTVVIGGIVRSQDDKGVSGLPWLQKIPVLGWLFKTEDISRTKRQLLIFVTPKILSGDGFAESEEKIIN